MRVQYGVLRYLIQSLLLQFSDYDYQVQAWVEASKNQNPFAGVEAAMESFLEDFAWSENQNLIGLVFQSNEELEVSLAMRELLRNFYRKKGRGLREEDYVDDPDWLEIIAMARHVLKIFLK